LDTTPLPEHPAKPASQAEGIDADAVLASNDNEQLTRQVRLPHRDLRWSALPIWFQIITYLTFGYTTLEFVALFATDPVHLAVLPIALTPALLGLLAAVQVGRGTPIPTRFYRWALIWGGAVATLLAGVINAVAAVLLGELVVIAFIAPFVEELLKLLVVLIIVIVSSTVTSTVVNRYTATATGIAVGAGFTLVEDVFYLANGSTFNEAVAIAFGRTFLSPFVHMACTAAVGYGVGLLIESRRRAGRDLIVLFTTAFTLHVLWNVASQVSFAFSLLLSIFVTGSFIVGVQLITADTRRYLSHLANVEEAPGEQVTVELIDGAAPSSDSVQPVELTMLEVRLLADDRYHRSICREYPAIRPELDDLRLAAGELLLFAGDPRRVADEQSGGHGAERLLESLSALHVARSHLLEHPGFQQIVVGTDEWGMSSPTPGAPLP